MIKKNIAVQKKRLKKDIAKQNDWNRENTSECCLL
jgi:hypothetical protein